MYASLILVMELLVNIFYVVYNHIMGLLKFVDPFLWGGIVHFFSKALKDKSQEREIAMVNLFFLVDLCCPFVVIF